VSTLAPKMDFVLPRNEISRQLQKSSKYQIVGGYIYRCSQEKAIHSLKGIVCFNCGRIDSREGGKKVYGKV